MLLYRLGQYHDAEEHLREAGTICEQLLARVDSLQNRAQAVQTMSMLAAVLTDEGNFEEADAVYAHPGFALTPVAANKSFITMDGLYLLGFGPRTAAAARDLSVKLYPALADGGTFTSALSAANCRQ